MFIGRGVIYICMAFVALLLSCSSGKKEGRQDADAISIDSSRVDGDTTCATTSDTISTLSLVEEVKQRVAAMYDDVFDHFNREDFAPWNYEKYFSDSLLALWNKLPDDEEVLDMDPWTWTQDYDTLAYTRIDVDLKAQDTARATVTLALWSRYESQVAIDLVRQQRGSQGSASWLINDFREGSHPDWPSVAEQIRDYLKE